MTQEPTESSGWSFFITLLFSRDDDRAAQGGGTATIASLSPWPPGPSPADRAFDVLSSGPLGAFTKRAGVGRVCVHARACPDPAVPRRGFGYTRQHVPPRHMPTFCVSDS